MFGAMMDAIKEESVGFLFNLEVQLDQAEAPDGTLSDEELDGLAAAGTPDGTGRIGVAGEPVPAGAPAAFTSGVEDQSAPASDERQRVAELLGQALGQPARPRGVQYSAPTLDGEGGVARSAGAAPAADGAETFHDVSRNAPCPCGSGRKFKRCHGAPSAR
jgi:preprotein translocase subunit SecA